MTYGSPPPKTSVGELIGQVLDQLSTLIRDELQLAQAQLVARGKKLGIGAGAFAVAGFFGFFGFALVLTTSILGLATVLPPWLASLIVTTVVLTIAAIAALLGKKKVDESKQHSADPVQNLKNDANLVADAAKKGLS